MMTTLTLHAELELDDFGLAVEEQIPLQAITALFGASGAGKTTLLRIIAGLHREAKARIAMNDEVWQDSDEGIFVPPHLRSAGFVFQDVRLFSHLTVAGNLEFARKRAADRKGPATEDVIRIFDLETLLMRAPDSLSGGELQRVSIARALLSNPSLLLMDEPLSALDAKRKTEILPYIEQLPEQFGLPVLYVTHNVDEVARLASHIVLLSQGHVVARGDATEVLARTDLKPLADHLEPGAVLETTVIERRGGMTTLGVGGQRLRVPGMSIDPGNGVRIRIQARDVALATQYPQGLSIRNVLDARIAMIEHRNEILAEVLLDVGGQQLRSSITGEAARELDLREGMQVFALIKSVAIEVGLAG
jgi:molybdate transport system ATP-binding protein